MSASLPGTRVLPAHQRGFTLVEISVAVLIGLFLLGGLLTVVQDNKRTFANQNQMTQLQDAERLAMTMIGNIIQSAGYYPNPSTFSSSVFTAITSPANMILGQYITGAGAAGAAAPGDTITLRYATLPNDRILTCNGAYNQTAVPTPTVYTSTFKVASGALVCSLNDPNAATNPTDYRLIGGPGSSVQITNLSILYGFNHSLTGDSADSYLDATGVNAIASATTPWAQVVSVKVSLTLTPQPVNGQPALAPVTFTRVINLMNAGGVQ